MPIMQNKDSYVIFDFCQTLCDFETADAFVEYVCEREISKRIKLLCGFECLLQRTKLVTLFDVFGHFAHYSLWKRLLLWNLKYISRESLEKYAEAFYKERVKPHLINETLIKLHNAKHNNFKVAVVSASYDIILKYFVKEYGVDLLVTNQLKYRNEIFTGNISESDCIYKNKVHRFYNAVHPNNVDVIESYGDSKSDIPILSIAKQGFVISRESHKQWVEHTNFKEIIWL